MKIYEDVMNWFSEHKTITKSIQYFVYGGILYATGFLQTQPEMQAAGLLAILSLVANWSKHNIELPLGVGTKVEKPVGKKK